MFHFLPPLGSALLGVAIIGISCWHLGSTLRMLTLGRHERLGRLDAYLPIRGRWLGKLLAVCIMPVGLIGFGLGVVLIVDGLSRGFFGG